MLDAEALETLGVKYKSTGGVGSLSWKGHQLVFRHPTLDEWDGYCRNKAQDPGSGPNRQISQVLLVAFDGDVEVTRARMAYGAFLSAGNAGFPNAPEVTALLATLAGTVQEEDIAHMGKVCRIWAGDPVSTPRDSQSGSGIAQGAPMNSATMPVPQQS